MSNGANLGTAHVTVRAVTPKNPWAGMERQSRALDRIGIRAGGRLSAAFQRGFTSLPSGRLFGNLARGIAQVGREGEGASRALGNMMRVGQVLTPAIGGLVGAISSLIGGLGSLIGSAGGAAGSLAALGSAGFAAAAGMIAAKLALGGVGKALSKLNAPGGGGGGSAGSGAEALAEAREAALERVRDAEENLALVIESNREDLMEANNSVRDAQLDLNEALKAGREEIQQIGFESEDAALAEKRAALELEDARRRLAAVQDLPPNSRARQEAELAYQEAELAYRKSKDAASDLAAEQERLAKTGVAGTQGVIDATEALADAEADRDKTVRDGLRAQLKAEEALADAKKDQAKAAKDTADAGSSGGGGADPYAGLNAAQKTFVDQLMTLRPEIDALKKATAEALLPNLWLAIKTIMDDTGQVFPVLLDGLTKVAGATGLAALEFAKAVEEGRNLSDLSTAFAGSADLIGEFGTVLANGWGVLITLIAEAMPLAVEFFGFLGDKLGAFDDWMDTVEGRKSLQNYFKLAGDAMAQWGEIFGNIFAGFGAIIEANLGPGTGGQILLDWFKESTAGFAALNDTIEGKAALKDYFNGAAENSKAVLQAVGALLGELIKLGDMPEIKETWDNLALGAPAMGKIAEAAITVGPSLGLLVSTIAKIAGVLTDADTGLAFFATLQAVAEKVLAFFEQKWVKEFMDFIAPITGVVLAIGGLFLGVQIALQIVLGAIMRFVGPLQVIFSLFASNPILIALAAIVGAVIYLWKTSETFRDSILSIFGELTSSFARREETGAVVSEIFATTIPLIMDTLITVFQEVMAAIEPVLVLVAQGISTLIQAILPLIPILLSSLLPALIQIVDTLGGAFADLIVALTPALGTIIGVIVTIVQVVVDLVGKLLPPIMLIITTLVDALAGPLVEIIGFVATAIADLLPKIVGPLLMMVEMLVPAILEIVDAFMPLIGIIADSLVPLFIGLLEPIMGIVTALIEMLMPVLLQLIEAILPLLDVFTALYPSIILIVQAVMDLAEAILPLVLTIVEALLPAFLGIIESVLPLVIGLIGVLIDVLMPLVPVFIEIVEILVSDLVPVFLQIATDVIPQLLDIIVTLIPTILSLYESFAPLIMIIIESVMPVIMQLVEAIAPLILQLVNILVPIIMTLAVVLEELLPPILGVIKMLIEALMPAVIAIISIFVGLVTMIINLLMPVIQLLIGIFVNFLIPVIMNVVQSITNFLLPIIEAIAEVMGGLIDFIVGVFTGDWEKAWQGVQGIFKGIVNGIISIFEGMINFIIDGINGFLGGLSGLAGAVKDLTGGAINISVGKIGRVHIPRLADGGTVMARPGGILAQIGEAGQNERVEPLDKDGLSKRDKAMIAELAGDSRGVTINVYQQPGENGEALANRVSEIISNKMRRGMA